MAVLVVVVVVVAVSVAVVVAEKGVVKQKGQFLNQHLPNIMLVVKSLQQFAILCALQPNVLNAASFLDRPKPPAPSHRQTTP